MFSGKSNWSYITELKQSVNIPVIGNGDVKNYSDYCKMKDYTNCDAIINILDIVTVVNMVIDGLDGYSDYELWAANINEDEIINILDIVSIVNIVMNGN